MTDLWFREGFEEAWAQRFGEAPAPDAPSSLAGFLRHRTVRRFDRSRQIPEPTVASLMGAAQSAATSSNLQLYSFVSVQFPTRREALAKLCGDQRQVREAAWFFAVCCDHHRLRAAAEAAGVDPAGLERCEMFTMATVDAALAAERMVCAAESLGIYSCYIGGLRNHPRKVAKLLRLPDGVFGLFGLCLGYPAAQSPVAVRPRLRPEAIWFREAYGPTPKVTEYDARMADADQRQGREAGGSWSQRSAERVTDDGIGLRRDQLEVLRERGFLLR